MLADSGTGLVLSGKEQPTSEFMKENMKKI
jgi:hypothetical protein